MTTTTSPAGPTLGAARGRTPGDGTVPTGRRWALTGVLAGLAGAVGILASASMTAVYDTGIGGDPAAIAAEVEGYTAQLLVFHTATMLATVLLLVFAVGLHRRLAAALPAGSLLPGVAAAGLGLVSVAGLMGSGLTTEFLFAPADPSETVLESTVFFSHWTGTIPWLWVGAGLAAVAVAVAALRHGAAARWLGWTSLGLGTVTLLVGLSPLQYLAGMVGPVWVLVAGLALTLERR